MAKTRGTNFDIFVGNVPPTGDEKTVRDLFSQYGEIKDIFMPESRKPSSTGAKIAFVHYTREEDANNAIEGKNGFNWNGSVLLVRKSDKWLKRIKDASNVNPSGTFVPKTIKSSHQLKKEKYEQAYNASNGGNLPSNSNYSPFPNDINSKPHYEERHICSMKLCLSHVVDPISFYANVQNDYDANQLMDLQNELNLVCSSAPVAEKLVINKIYATRFSEDETWYRCRVEAVDNYLSKAKVHYIDFGNSEQVSCQGVVEIPAHLANVPYLAIHCEFYDLLVVDGLYQEAMAELQDITAEKLLHASGFKTNSSQGECFMVVNLEGDGFNIIAHLTENGFLARSKTSPVPSPLYEKRGLKDRKNVALDKMEKMSNFASATSAANRLKMGNNFKGLNKKNAYAYGSNSSISDHGCNIGANMLVSEIESLRMELSKERGKSEALEKRNRKLMSQQQQKPDILSQCDVFSQITSLLADIPRVTITRQQLPVGPGMGISQDCVETAIHLLWKGKEHPTPSPDHDSLKNVNHWENLYREIQRDISLCPDAKLLPELISKRNEIRLEFHGQLKYFCDLVEGMPLRERVSQLGAVLIDLQKTYEPFLQMRTTSNAIPIQLQDLVMFYRKIKEECASKFRDIQFKTNQAHSALMESLDLLNKALALHARKNIFSRSTSPRREFSEKQILAAVRELKKCLQREIAECNLERTNHASVMAILTQQLYKELSTELEKARCLSDSEASYRQTYEEITPWLRQEPDLERIVQLRKETKKIRSKFRHKLADKSDLDESEEKDEAAICANVSDLNKLRFELQKKFHEDDSEMRRVIVYYRSVFPELNLQYPDLRIEQYDKYDGLVKHVRQIEYYNVERVENKMGIDCYVSTFLNAPVTLKQYLTECDQMQESFLDRAKQYAALQSEHLLKIDAIFFSSNCRVAYVQQERRESWLHRLQTQSISLEEKLLILSAILEALNTLHSANLIHGCLHPDTVFVKNQNYAILDTIPLLESKLQNLTLPSFNGINFQCPGLNKPCPENDIYAFFCVALWFFFPNTTFTVDEDGIPDLTRLEVSAELEEHLSPIYKILHTPPAEYPTALELLTNYSLFARKKRLESDEDELEAAFRQRIPNEIVTFEERVVPEGDDGKEGAPEKSASEEEEDEEEEEEEEEEESSDETGKEPDESDDDEEDFQQERYHFSQTN